MDFVPTDEQQELRRSARRFLENVSTGARVRAVMKTELGFDPEVYARVAGELGWTGLVIPEAYGGLGMTPADLHPLMEEMGRAVFCSPFFSTVCLGTYALLVGGDEAQKARWLPSIAAGEARATLALTEDHGRFDVGAVTTEAWTEGGRWRLRGEKRFVVDGHTADLLIVAARERGSAGEEGLALYVVPGETEGVSRKLTPTMDATRKLADVGLDVTLPHDARLARADVAAIERALDLATAALAAEQVGGAERCLDLAVEYAKVRQQFGRPIGSFQAIKHRCADMLVRVESARSAALWASFEATEALAHPEAPADRLHEAASAAKAYASEAFFCCASECIQIHGGIGFTWEHDAHLFFKRSKSSETLLGTPSFHRERVARAMGI